MLTLRDPGARRAVFDFAKADTNGSGHLSEDGAGDPSRRSVPLLTPPAEFTRYFGLEGDLFLGRVIATMDDRQADGNIDLVEFLNGVACFAASSKEEKDHRIRAIAFQMMDIRHKGRISVDHLKKFATLAYEQFLGRKDTEWGDTGRSQKTAKNLEAVHRTIDRFCGEEQLSLDFALFQRLADELPLIIAPAHFLWSTFDSACSPRPWHAACRSHPLPAAPPRPACPSYCAQLPGALRCHGAAWAPGVPASRHSTVRAGGGGGGGGARAALAPPSASATGVGAAHGA